MLNDYLNSYNVGYDVGLDMKTLDRPKNPYDTFYEEAQWYGWERGLYDGTVPNGVWIEKNGRWYDVMTANDYSFAVLGKFLSHKQAKKHLEYVMTQNKDLVDIRQ